MNESLGNCPVCSGELSISEYKCNSCNISIKGQFKRCDICNLPKDLVHFVLVFLACEGNIKEVERELGLSYPTVKSRLSKIKQLLDLGTFKSYVKTQNRIDMLKKLKEGKISVNDALENLL